MNPENGGVMTPENGVVVTQKRCCDDPCFCDVTIPSVFGRGVKRGRDTGVPRS